MLRENELSIQCGVILYMGVKYEFLSNYRKFKSFDALVNDKEKSIELIFHKHGKGKKISLNVGTVDSLGFFMKGSLSRLGFKPTRAVKVKYERTKSGLVLYLKKHCK